MALIACNYGEYRFWRVVYAGETERKRKREKRDMRKIKKKEKGETDKNEREYVNYHCLKIINMKNM